MKKVVLYTYWRSSCSWRVRTVLHTKGIAFESTPVHLVRGGGEQRGEAYRAKHPIGQVPLLEWVDAQGQTCRLGQSMAIALFLERLKPTPALLPDDPYDQGRVLAAAELVNAGIQPLQNLSVLQHLEAHGGARSEWASHWIDRGLRALEAQVQGETGPFLFGAKPSLADVFLVPQLYNARRYALELEAYPRLLEAEGACQALPAFQAAHPDAQPDAE